MSAAALEDLCGLIERTLLGEQAKALLTASETSHLVLLPMWAWVKPEVSLGKKQSRADEFPVRVHWNGALVRPVRETTTLRWKINGLGVTDKGTQKVTTQPGPHLSGVPYRAEQPEVISASALATLVEDGDTARWEFLQLLEQVTAAALERCHSQLVREYSLQTHGDPSTYTQPILHTETLEAMRMRLVYGDTDSTDPSTMMRVIQSSHEQDFANVEPQRWLKVWVSKIVRDWVLREAGDPEAGALIRRTSRDLGSEDPEQIAAALHGVGTKRIEAALALAPHPDAAPVRFQFYPEDVDDHWLHSQMAHARRFM